MAGEVDFRFLNVLGQPLQALCHFVDLCLGSGDRIDGLKQNRNWGARRWNSHVDPSNGLAWLGPGGSPTFFPVRFRASTNTMTQQTQGKRGRPATTGKGVTVGPRLHPPLLAALDRYIAKRGGGLSRAGAIREILAEYFRLPKA